MLGKKVLTCGGEGGLVRPLRPENGSDAPSVSRIDSCWPKGKETSSCYVGLQLVHDMVMPSFSSECFWRLGSGPDSPRLGIMFQK